MSVLFLHTFSPGELTARGRRSPGLMLAACGLAVLLVSNVPLHVCLPLASDTVLYDLQARTVLSGGVLYRDVFETNLPGIVWVHAAVRTLVGWSSEAIRLVDLAVLAGIVWLVTRWLRRQGTPAAAQAATAFACCWCYLSVSEWCHCQRDTWMLLPALAAVSLRFRRIEVSSARVPSGRAIFGCAFVEGLLWAAAFWIKPFVAVPALACWGLSALWGRDWRRLALDGSGLLLGGLVLGAAGVIWLQATGAWPFFLETFLEWNPDYIAGGRSRWTLDRMYGIGYRLFPWIVIHLAAVPVAISLVRRAAGVGCPEFSFPHAARNCNQTLQRKTEFWTPDPSLRTAGLLAVFYLGWLAQAVFAQQPFDYIQVPPILLGLVVLAAGAGSLWKRRATRAAATAFVIAAALTSPALKPDRLAGWWDCLTGGSTPAIRDRLAYLRTPNYGELEQVAAFLRSQDVRDGDLTCFHVHLIHLYPRLAVRPSTRYVGLEALRRLFPRHRESIDASVAATDQRFVVTDLVEAGLGVEAARDFDLREPCSLPPGFPADRRREFPWNLPVAYRSGRYVVHAAVPIRGRVQNSVFRR